MAQREDLDLDLAALSGAGRNALVTRVLAQCRSEVGDAAARVASVWRLTLAGRIGGLAAIVALTRESANLPLIATCPACGERLDLELPLDVMIYLARRAEQDRTLTIDVAGRSLRLRRVTGDDQRRWQEQTYDSLVDAERSLVASLLDPKDQELSPDEIDRIRKLIDVS